MSKSLVEELQERSRQAEEMFSKPHPQKNFYEEGLIGGNIKEFFKKTKKQLRLKNLRK